MTAERLVLRGPTGEADPGPPAVTERLDEGVWRSRLPGGPTIVSERIETARSVALGLWVRQGTVHEAPERRGISHFLEHMVFKGTERRSAREIALAIERVGGALDAFTSHDQTVFHTRVPEGETELAVDVLLDLVFRPRMEAAEMEAEREVILEEIASLQDQPDQVAFERHAELLYGGHPYGEPVIGTRETVSALELGDLETLHRTRYRPDNVVVAAAGRLRHDQLLEAVSTRLPATAATDPPEVPPLAELRPGHHSLVRPGGRQSHIVAGAPTVPYSHPLRVPLAVVDSALGGGMSSRLFQGIREELGLAYSVYSFLAFYRGAGHAGAYVATRPATAGRAKEALLGELERLSRSGLEPEELATTRRQLVGQLKLSLESTGARMGRLGETVFHEEPYRPVEELSRRVEAVTEDTAREAARLLDPGRLTVLELDPSG